MRVGKRSICGIMAGILFMMEPVSGYGMMREGTWKKDIRNQIMEIQQMQPELTPYTGPEITAPSAILMEASTGTVICEKNADEPRNPASVTKIMTLILIFDALQSGKICLTDEVVTSAHAKSMGGSQVFLEEGEIQTAVLIPKESYENCFGHYIKYAMRNAMDIATLGTSVNVRLSADKKTVERARVAFGVAGPVPLRAATAEAMAKGQPVSLELAERFAQAVTADINPRDSWRAAKDFRLHIAVESAKRAFIESVKLAGGEL